MTSPLGSALQDLGNASDPRQLPPPETLRTAGDRRRRRTTLRLTAVAAIACSVLVLVLARSGPSDPVSQPADLAPSPTSTPQAERPDERSMLHPIGTGAHRFSAHAIAARDGRFVVVGDSSDFNDPGPAVYWSDNGVDWQPPPAGNGPDSVNVTDVIATRTSFLAVGVRPDGPGAWRSVDGRTWVESPVTTSADRGPDGLWGITDTRLGYYAWGFDGGRAHLWRSADGTAWTPVADESVFDLPGRETICAVWDVEGGLRATGVVAPPNTREGHRVAWTSSDGETWVLAQAAGASTLWCDPTEQLGHWKASSDVGQVRIDPNGSGDYVELVPTAP